MMSNGERQTEEVPLFRPFTNKSRATIEVRIAEAKTRKAEREHLKAEGEIGPDGVPKYCSVPHEEDTLKPNPKLEVGRTLPRALASSIPPNLIATPIEDLDKYYEKEKTFMMISKGKGIFRFSADDSLYLLSPFNPLRQLAMKILLHPAFSILIIATILINCIIMTIEDDSYIFASEIVFTSIYTLEFCIKVVARGFILGKFTYLRDPWNWLDFILNIFAYLTMVGDFGNVEAFRAFRILRALKVADIITGLKTIVEAVGESLKKLKDIAIVTLFSIIVFALIGLHIYAGALSRRCVKEADSKVNLTLETYTPNWNYMEENWYEIEDKYVLCGNASGSRSCPFDYVCVQAFGANPDYGYTNFDSFPWALLSTYRLITLDYWESLFQMVIETSGTWQVLFFLIVVFFGSFYLMNLILAVVVTSYAEMKMKANEEAAANFKVATSRLDARGSDEHAPYKKPRGSPFLNPHRQTTVEMKDLIVANDVLDQSTGSQRKDSKREGSDEEKSFFKECCVANCMKFIDAFCIWDCCKCFVNFQEIISRIVFHPFMELFITLCIIVNTLFMAMDHHDMELEFALFLSYGNYVFLLTFTIEAIFKILALGPKYYFADGWNRFDFIVVAVSVPELIFEGVRSILVLRWLRVFKLAKVWPSFNLLLSMLGRSVGAILNIIIVMTIFIIIFAIMGMQLFGKSYIENKHRFYEGEVPYFNFIDFMHSFMIVFRAFCGEWIESMWDCVLVSNWTCIPFFVATSVIGNLMVVKLFLASFIFSLATSQVPDESPETKKLQEAVDCIFKPVTWVKNCFLQTLKSNQLVDKSPEEANDTSLTTGEDKGNGASGTNDKTRDMHQVETTTSDMLSEYPPDCCSGCCYVKFPFLSGEDTVWWNRWKEMRRRCFVLVEHKYFETFVLTIIFLSILSLAAEDINIEYRVALKKALHYLDTIFAILFLLEMLLRWLADGFTKYFTNSLCWLDFVVVLLSTFNLVSGLLGYSGILLFKTIRTLRAVRAISYVECLRVVANALVRAIPAIFNVFLVGLILWLLFAILGVQMMGGHFYFCHEEGARVNVTVAYDKEMCMMKNLTWENKQINFDNVLNAYLALFQVATFKGWIDIKYAAVDSNGINLQPEKEANVYMYFYFVVFIIVGTFITLNLIFAVIINSFNEQKLKAGGSVEIIMTENQKKYYKAMKRMGSKRPVKANSLPRPQFNLQRIVLNLITNKKFDMLITIFLCLNLVVLTTDHFYSMEMHNTVLEGLNIFFVAIFTAECLLKIFALHTYYFKEPWNIFDFTVVILSILGIILEELMEEYFVSTSVLQIVGVIKVIRLLRLVRFVRGIRNFFFSLAMCLPAIFNILLLLFLITFIYAIFGMSFFMHVKSRGYLDENFNFRTIQQSLILLFQMLTTAGWDGLLVAIMEEEDCELPDTEMDMPGDCGHKFLSIAYLVSYMTISLFIIMSMYIAVILETYRLATEDIYLGLTDNAYDMYYEIWRYFDSDSTQFIKYSALSAFLDALEEPLQVPKPNKYKISLLDIPIREGELVFCDDILDALRKDIYQRKGHSIEEPDESDAAAAKEREFYKPISSTQRRQREINCARIIQCGYRRYKGQPGDSEQH